MALPLRVLIVEDNPDDAELMILPLTQAGFQPDWQRVETEADYLSALEYGRSTDRPYELILSDWCLPHFSGRRALQLLSERDLDIPFVIVSGSIGEETAIDALRNGADDYVLKDRPARLGQSVRRALEDKQLREQRQQAEQAQRESEERFRALTENATDLVIVLNPDGSSSYISPSVERILGFKPDEVSGRNIADFVHPDDLPAALEAINIRLQTPGLADRASEFRVRHKDGTYRTMEVIGNNLLDDPSVGGIVINARDITERKQAEERILFQNKIMEASNSIFREAQTCENVEKLARTCLSVAERMTGSKFGFIGELNRAGRLDSIVVSEPGWEACRIPDSERKKLLTDMELRGLWASVIQEEKSLLTNDPPSHPQWLGLLEGHPPLTAFLGVPLKQAGKTIGMIALGNKEGGYTPADQEALEIISTAIIESLLRKRAEIDTQRRLQNIEALRTIDQAISASLNIKLTLSIILEQVLKQLEADAAAVLLLNQYTQMLEYAAGRGFHGKGIEHSRLRVGEGHAGRAALERHIVSVYDLHKDNKEFVPASLLSEEDFDSYYGVPLIAKGQVKGVLEVFLRAFHKADVEWQDFLITLAGQVAIAVDNAELFDGLQRSNTELHMAYDATIEGWSSALDLRDKETEGHSQRVTKMTMDIGRALGMTESELVRVRRGALLHDIGKMGVPDAILFKPSALSDEEWVIMRQHPQHAHDMLSPIAYLRPALEIPFGHHEKWDGTGYPRGLKGDQIPLAARVFAVVDVWDALTSDRPYRAAWQPEKAIEYIREQAGKHFDPQVVEVFFKTIGI